MVGSFVIAQYDFPVELDSVGVFEGEVTDEHCVEGYAAGPDVDVETVVSFACYHFGSGVAGGSTCCY